MNEIIINQIALSFNIIKFWNFLIKIYSYIFMKFELFKNKPNILNFSTLWKTFISDNKIVYKFGWFWIQIWYSGAQKINYLQKMSLAKFSKILIKNFWIICLKNKMLLCLSDANQPTASSELK